jgi:hypothetical protein
LGRNPDLDLNVSLDLKLQDAGVHVSRFLIRQARSGDADFACIGLRGVCTLSEDTHPDREIDWR